MIHAIDVFAYTEEHISATPNLRSDNWPILLRIGNTGSGVVNIWLSREKAAELAGELTAAAERLDRESLS